MKKGIILAVATMVLVSFSGIVNAGSLGKYDDFANWPGAEGTTLEKSQENKTTGEHSVKVIMPAGAKYPGIVLENLGVYNLGDAKAMKFDCFNATSKTIKCNLKLKSEGKKDSISFSIPVGQNTVSIPLNSAGVDMTAVKYMKIWTGAPGDEIVLYLDNLRFE